MSRYTGPSFKQSRSVGFSTLENGKELARRNYKPGMHGAKRQGKLSNYGEQLKEKQKVKFMYGMNERQFHKTFIEAGHMQGIHGENFLKLLESRLDNVVYRMGMAPTRRAARQIVNHGHILVNGVKTDIPSFECKPGTVISVKENSLEHPVIKASIEAKLPVAPNVEFDAKKMSGTFVRYPERTELSADINEALVVEFYNR